MKQALIFVVVLALCLPVFVHAEINRTLRLGDRGLDVKELQLILNSDPDTRIAEAGIGSPGNESTYFGVRTLLAVKKFQIKHAFEVLTPAGLSSPTGVVGYYTRALVYKISQTNAIVPVSITTLPTPVQITSITPTVVTQYPQTVTIFGKGFTPTNNTIYISSEPEAGIVGIPSPDGTQLTFTYSYAGATRAIQQLAQYKNNNNYTAIKTAYLENIREVAPMVLVVKNANGESAPRTFSVNLGGML